MERERPAQEARWVLVAAKAGWAADSNKRCLGLKGHLQHPGHSGEVVTGDETDDLLVAKVQTAHSSHGRDMVEGQRSFAVASCLSWVVPVEDIAVERGMALAVLAGQLTGISEQVGIDTVSTCTKEPSSSCILR